MGTIKHEAIVCTSNFKDHIQKAHKKAVSLFPKLVSNIIISQINGYYSFFIAPDGSKEGWPESDAADIARATFKDYIKRAYMDNRLYVDLAHISYGGDDKKTIIIK